MSQFERNIEGILSQSLAQMENILNRPPLDYTTAYGESVDERDSKVRALIKDGWYISGNAYVCTEKYVTTHCQPMVKYWGAK